MRLLNSWFMVLSPVAWALHQRNASNELPAVDASAVGRAHAELPQSFVFFLCAEGSHIQSVRLWRGTHFGRPCACVAPPAKGWPRSLDLPEIPDSGQKRVRLT